MISSSELEDSELEGYKQFYNLSVYFFNFLVDIFKQKKNFADQTINMKFKIRLDTSA